MKKGNELRDKKGSKQRKRKGTIYNLDTIRSIGNIHLPHFVQCHVAHPHHCLLGTMLVIFGSGGI